MSDDTPIANAIKNLPINELEVDGGIDSSKGGFVKGSVEREFESKDISIGAEGEVSQSKSWSIMGFFRKKFK